MARVLGPDGVGRTQFALTFCQYIALLAALGIPIYGIREIARVKHSPAQLSKTFLELLIINVATCIFCSIIFLAVVLRLSYFQHDSALFLYSSVLILLGFTSIDWLYVGLEAFKLMAIRSIIVKIIALALILLLVRRSEDVLTFLMINVGAILTNNAVNLWHIRGKVNWRLDGLDFKRHLRPLFFIYGTTIASTLYTTFDTVLLGLLSGNHAVGIYTAATKLTKIAIPVITALGGTLIGEITRHLAEDKSKNLEAVLNKSFAYIALLGVPTSAILFVFAPALTLLFSGSAFHQAITTMRIMAYLPILIGLGYFWGYQVILPMRKENFLMYAALAGMAVSLILNVLLTPRLNENGAAIANVASELVVTVCYYLLIKKYVQIHIRQSQLLHATLASAPFFLFLFLPVNYVGGSVAMTFVVGACIGGILYLLLQILVFRNPTITEYAAKLLLRSKR